MLSPIRTCPLWNRFALTASLVILLSVTGPSVAQPTPAAGRVATMPTHDRASATLARSRLEYERSLETLRAKILRAIDADRKAAIRLKDNTEATARVLQ